MKSKKKKSAKNDIAIIVALIGAIGTIIAAIITSAGSKPQQQQQSAVSSQENISVASKYNTEGKQEIVFQVTHEDGSIISTSVTLEDFQNPTSGANTIKSVIDSLPEESKYSFEDVDLLTQFAETASANASTKNFSGADLFINANELANIIPVAKEVNSDIEKAFMEKVVFLWKSNSLFR